MNPDEIKVIEKTEVITQRERSAANAAKIEALKDVLDVVGEEDVDKVFLTVLETLKTLQYNLQGEPTNILSSIERQFA